MTISENEVIQGFKVISINKVRRIINSDGSSKGWYKNVTAMCQHGHIHTLSYTSLTHAKNNKNTIICPTCNSISKKQGKIEKIKIKNIEKEKNREANLLKTLRPDLEKYFLDKNDFSDNTAHSNKNVKLVCPKCGKTKTLRISTLTDYGFTCKYCSDSRSIPERFLSEILDCNNIDYIFDKSMEWSDGKRYDFYLPKYNAIIETHGAQHYNGSFSHIGGRTLKEERCNDTLKMEMALNNGISIYDVLDCRKSTYEHMVNSIKNSVLLSKILLDKTVYKKCYASVFNNDTYYNSCIKQFNELYRENSSPQYFNEYVKNISKNIGVTTATVVNNLNVGRETEECFYDGDSSVRSYKRKNAVKIFVPEINKIFESLGECARYFNICNATIRYYTNRKNRIRNKYQNAYTFIEVS